MGKLLSLGIWLMLWLEKKKKVLMVDFDPQCYTGHGMAPDPDAARTALRSQKASSGKWHRMSACGYCSCLWACLDRGAEYQDPPALFPAAGTAPRSGSCCQTHAAHGCAAYLRPGAAPSLKCVHGSRNGGQIPHKISGQSGTEDPEAQNPPRL